MKHFCAFGIALSCLISSLPIQAKTQPHCCCDFAAGQIHCPNSSPCQTPTPRSSPSSNRDADRSTALPLAENKSFRMRSTLPTPTSRLIWKTLPKNQLLTQIPLTFPNVPTHTRLAQLCCWLT